MQPGAKSKSGGGLRAIQDAAAQFVHARFSARSWSARSPLPLFLRYLVPSLFCRVRGWSQTACSNNLSQSSPLKILEKAGGQKRPPGPWNDPSPCVVNGPHLLRPDPEKAHVPVRNALFV